MDPMNMTTDEMMTGGHGHHTMPAGMTNGHGHHTMPSGMTGMTEHIHPSNGTHTDHDMDMMMQMTFYLSTKVTILFEQWAVNSVGGLIGSCIAVFVLAMFYEGLKVGRELLLRRSVVNVRYHSQQISKGSETFLTETHNAGEAQLLSWGHVIQTLLHVVQVTLSYFLMLIFMTYNGYLCIAVVMGAGTGYFIFGWKKAIVVDINEHCH
ncbi:high affinity copper uptake protein 1 [Strongylocentrotus purpuratus]|uniref:Copper transport protein n=1 Tax=Strongylocentrotus purpuratus TaxID=7668 RepID=A0A7M7RCY9_STRPU|nr:high affinity copper uptake protein 1 [Strongylocentrotus purpuratus]|eukprot:XP_785308.1 PREDICTED: high affinity copper uptake protein 1 [Strongylocentrotus purpuratus]